MDHKFTFIISHVPSSNPIIWKSFLGFHSMIQEPQYYKNDVTLKNCETAQFRLDQNIAVR